MVNVPRTLRLAAFASVLALSACSQSDTALTRRVEAQIQAEAPTEQVKVTTDRRVVRLEGMVENTAELNRIDAATRRVPGVLAVDNRLSVKPPVSTTGAEQERSQDR